MGSDPRFLTPREAAAVLKVHERTILRWVADGRLPARRIGRRIRIEEDTIRTPGEASGPADRATLRIGKRPGANPPKGSPKAVLRCAGLLGEKDRRTLMEPILKTHDEPWEES